MYTLQTVHSLFYKCQENLSHFEITPHHNLERDNECAWRPFTDERLEHLWNDLKWNGWRSFRRLDLVLGLKVKTSITHLLSRLRCSRPRPRLWVPRPRLI